MSQLNSVATALLAILSDHLDGRPTCADVLEGVSCAELIELANIHEVGGIVYKQCQALLPDGPREALARTYASQAYYYANRVHVSDGIMDALGEAGIEAFQVKGLPVAGLFPVPALRTMGDCDIVVHEADKERAHQIFMGRGFANTLKENHEWIYFLNGQEFELHHGLLYADEAANFGYEVAFCDTVWDHVHDGRLDWSYHFVYLLLHLKKHLIHDGRQGDGGLSHF